MEYQDMMDAEEERSEITAVLCFRWGCSPDEIADEDIRREKRKRDREFRKTIRRLEREPA